MTKQKRADEILNILKRAVSHARTTLRYANNWQLFVAVLLSAQCTDIQVNKVTVELFKKYKTVSDFKNINNKTLERLIRPVGFYHTKAKNIIASAKIIDEKFGGNIPKTMKEMLTLPGVGRKTANVVLGKAYGITEGIAVDTHVIRLANRFGLTKSRSPKVIEKDLMTLFPKKEWLKLTDYFIAYGRKYCSAKKHNHSECSLKRFDRKT
jgi:endonuclease-3